MDKRKDDMKDLEVCYVGPDGKVHLCFKALSCYVTLKNGDEVHIQGKAELELELNPSDAKRVLKHMRIQLVEAGIIKK